MTGSVQEVQALPYNASDGLEFKLLILKPGLSALPLVGIYFALPLNCLTSHATRWEQIMMTCLLFQALPVRLKRILMHLHTSLSLSPG